MTSQPTPPRTQTLPLGVVLQRRAGVTRWARHVWQPVAVLPGAAPADWHLLRDSGDTQDYHAATLPLSLHRADVEAYKVALTMSPPAVFVILRTDEDPDAPHEVAVLSVTASAYEAQDYQDSGEEIVEAVPMPEGLVAWVRDFTDQHFHETPFIKRKRDRERTDLKEDGIGDARIRQAADVYRAPGTQKTRKSGP